MTVIDEYLQKIEPPKRKELERIRTIAKKIVPNSEEVIKYGMPTLLTNGQPYLGFDAHKNHIGIYPFSGEVIELLKDQLGKYGLTKGAIQVRLDEPILESDLKKIIEQRLRMLHL
ncbi:hypothetical protein BH09PAT1_BH09PAT1_7370 [soil metagenome]